MCSIPQRWWDVNNLKGLTVRKSFRMYLLQGRRESNLREAHTVREGVLADGLEHGNGKINANKMLAVFARLRANEVDFCRDE